MKEPTEKESESILASSLAGMPDATRGALFHNPYDDDGSPCS
jgi:hypothetical protein